MPRGSTRHIEPLLPVGKIDSGTVPLSFTVSASETAFIGSFGTLNLALMPSTAYEGPNAEFGTLNFTFTISSVDVEASGDSNTEVLTFYPGGQESVPDLGTIPLTFTVSGIEFLPHVYPDAGTVVLTFTPDFHGCFNHPIPSYDFTFDKHWLIAASETRWQVFDYETRWQCQVVGVEPFDNSCP